MNTGNRCNQTTGSAYSGIGLQRQDGGVFAVGVVGTAAGAGRPCAFQPSDLDVNGASLTNLNAPVPGADNGPTNVALDGTTAYFIGRNGARVFSSTMSGCPSACAWSAPVEAQLGAFGNVFSGSAIFNDGSTKRLALGTVANSDPGDLHYFTPADGGYAAISVGGFRVGVPSLLSTPGPAVVRAFAGVGGSTPGLMRFGQTANAGPATTGIASSAPVLGMNQLGYIVDTLGQLVVFKTDNTFSAGPEWQADLGLLSVVAAPSLDCVRAGTTGIDAGVGVLYVASSSGTVTAILVDSPKLNTAVDGWPRYQRTAGNAGNTDPSFGLNPGCP